MNLLSSFFFVFDADASKVTKQIDASKKETKGLTEELNTADKVADKLGKSFIDMAKSAGKAFVAITSLNAIKNLTLDTAAHTAAVYDQARAMAVSVESVSAWGQAISASGGNAATAVASMASLRDKFVEIAKNPAGVGPESFMFNRLGLTQDDIRKSVTDPTIALVKLGDTFKGLNDTQAQFAGKQIGLDPATIALLQQGSAAVAEQIRHQKELGVVTKEQAAAAMALRVQQHELGIQFETVARETTGMLLPALTWLLKKVNETVSYLREHKIAVIAFFSGVALVVADMVVPAMASAAVATWAFLAPILAGPVLIGALIAVLALLAEDVYAFMRGQQSMIGNLSTRWPTFGEVVKLVVRTIAEALKLLNASIKDVLDYFIALSDFIVDIFTKGPSKALDALNSKTASIAKDMTRHFKALFDTVTSGSHAVAGAWDGVNAQASMSDGDKKAASSTGAEIYKKLVSSGWSPIEAAGITGNVMQESSGNPNAKNPTSGMYGLGQWDTARRADFAKVMGKPIEGSSVDEQLAFLTYEMREGKEQRAGMKLHEAKSVADAAKAVSKYYERAGSDTNDARRVGFATAVYGDGRDPLRAGKTALAETNVPVSSQSSQTIANSTNTRNGSNVSVGGVTVHTQATDAKALSQDIGTHLRREMSNAVDQHDDGVAA